jgi:hypothetical protein
MIKEGNAYVDDTDAKLWKPNVRPEPSQKIGPTQ